MRLVVSTQPRGLGGRKEGSFLPEMHPRVTVGTGCSGAPEHHTHSQVLAPAECAPVKTTTPIGPPALHKLTQISRE